MKRLSEYVLEREETSDPVGHLVREARADEDWPTNAGYVRLRAYLKQQGAAQGALKALAAVADEQADELARQS